MSFPESSPKVRGFLSLNTSDAQCLAENSPIGSRIGLTVVRGVPKYELLVSRRELVHDIDSIRFSIS